MSSADSTEGFGSGYDDGQAPNITSTSASRPSFQTTPKQTSRQSSRPFTEKMKERQARHADPFDSEESEEHSNYEQGVKYDGYDPPSYEARQKRREAAIILDSPELLMMHAQARSDTIHRTRLHFLKMLCEMETDEFPRTKDEAPPSNSEREKRKHKDRKTL